MKDLVVGASGVRGIVGKSLTPEIMTRLGAAFGTYLNSGKVVVGRDTRVSGDMLKHAVFAGLISTGCRIIDLDVCTTPTCALMVKELKADGGIIITGSHNPIEWNALKFLRSDGIFLNVDQGKQLIDCYYSGDFVKVTWDKLQVVETDHSSADKHLEKVLSSVDIEIIRKKKFSVVLDSCNGAGSLITPALFEKLHCRMKAIHVKPNGLFPHNPEPTFANLTELCSVARHSGVDIGFAQDADADRLAIVDERGEFIGEEYSLALAARFVLSKHSGIVVTNLSTSRLIEDIAEKYNSRVIRTPVGEVNVADRMKSERAVIGGEGNGGIINPEVHYVRDSLSGIAMILQYLAETGKKVSELVDELPKYHIRKEKIECKPEAGRDIIKELTTRYRREKIDLQDGLRVDWHDAWFSLRISNTEPVIRIIAEGRTRQKVDSLIESLVKEIKRTK